MLPLPSEVLPGTALSLPRPERPLNVLHSAARSGLRGSRRLLPPRHLPPPVPPPRFLHIITTP